MACAHDLSVSSDFSASALTVYKTNRNAFDVTVDYADERFNAFAYCANDDIKLSGHSEEIFTWDVIFKLPPGFKLVVEEGPVPYHPGVSTLRGVDIGTAGYGYKLLNETDGDIVIYRGSIIVRLNVEVGIVLLFKLR